MADLPFTALTTEQRARVTWLFADNIFGADPAAFIYEIEGDSITRRPQQTASQRRAAQGTRVQVIAMDDPMPTNQTRRQFGDELTRLARYCLTEVSRCQMTRNSISPASCTPSSISMQNC